MEVGTKFVGKVNGHPFQLVDVKVDSLSGNEYAVIKDLKSEQVFEYGMTALEHCEIEVIP